MTTYEVDAYVNAEDGEPMLAATYTVDIEPGAPLAQLFWKVARDRAWNDGHGLAVDYDYRVVGTSD